MAALEHAAGHLAAHQEAGETAHLPDLAVDAGGRLGDRKVYIGANIEDRHLDRRNVALDLFHQGDHRLFVARIRRQGDGFMPVGADAFGQIFQRRRVARPAHQVRHHAFAGKGAARIVASADG